LFDAAFRSQSKYATRKQLMIELKLRAGWYEEHVTDDGRIVYVPLSLKWAQMGQEDFDRFYDEAIVALADMFGTEEIVLEADQIIARNRPTDFAGQPLENET
jgi:hypothetical protein